MDGVGAKRVKQIVQTLSERRGAQEAMLFLHGLGLTSNMAAKIYRRYSDDTVRLIRENPYRLAYDVRGIGFLRADEAARGMGIGPDAPERVQAGLHYCLSQATSAGHCFLPRAVLVRETSLLLGVDEALCEPALGALKREARIVVDPERDPSDPAIYPSQLFRAEGEVAAQMAALLQPVPDSGTSQAIMQAANALSLTPSDDQVAALKMVLAEGAAVLTGGPGTGKTTIIRILVNAVGLDESRIALAAPTGRAAKRLAEATGLEAKTIHRMLEYSPMDHSFRRDADHPLDASLVIVDEASMLDLPILPSKTFCLFCAYTY